MALAGLFLLVVHEVIPRGVLGSARPIVEGSVGITLATLLVVLTGGPASPFFFAFALIVAGAALVLPPRMTILVTAVRGRRLSRRASLADPARLPLERAPQVVVVGQHRGPRPAGLHGDGRRPASSAGRATPRSGCPRSTR